jgi:putative two-component system response regulator
MNAMSSKTEISIEFMKTLVVLYVEDEDEVREALAHFLSRRFAKVDMAKNGLEGLEKFRNNHYDIVITDVKMPIMDGLEMAKHIKEITEDTPVIVVTAFNETDYFMRAIEIGVDRYVKKPVDADSLYDAIYKSTRVHFQQKALEKER